jgi:hypothetical protein
MNLFHVSGNKKAYTFEWGTNGSSVPKIGNFLWNSKSDRAKAADAMVKAIMVRVKENGGSEDVTLIGHSHGGNVAIQAVPGLRKALDDAGYKDVKINLVTVATPADNKAGSKENPATYSTMINKHIHLWNEKDAIQKSGANAFNTDIEYKNGLMNVPEKVDVFSKTYNNGFTQNVQLDVSKLYSGELAKVAGITIGYNNGVGAHSVDVNNPEVVKGAIDSGKIPKITGKKSKPSGLVN